MSYRLPVPGTAAGQAARRSTRQAGCSWSSLRRRAVTARPGYRTGNPAYAFLVDGSPNPVARTFLLYLCPARGEKDDEIASSPSDRR
ncbi:hypothetical protein Jiend_18480 [Micromonospora endophytica]|nr:hypothetical protein Jiend_18480 [Micromonospora endophytica]